MVKRSYRSVEVKVIDIVRLQSKVGIEVLSVGIDVAKEKFYAALMLPDGEVVCTVKWQHPAETGAFVALLKALPQGTVNVALESTGRYGDILVAQLRQAQISVFGANTKRVHDAAEEYDGVPSKHDSKDAAIIADLQRRGKNNPLREQTASERQISALVRMFLVFKDQYERNINRIEAELARFWPELTDHLRLQSVSLVSFLTEFGGPKDAAADPVKAKKSLHSSSRGALSSDTIDTIIASAKTTLGVVALREEIRMLQLLAKDTLRAMRDADSAEKSVHAAVEQNKSAAQQSKVLGKTTAAVIMAKSGDVAAFEAPKSWVKNLGLNLKENSSGKPGQRGVGITKRGSPQSRQYMYMAALRLIQTDPVVAQWYAYQTQRPGSVKMKVIVALMRKLAKAMWHVARGETFDASKLFNMKRFANITAEHQQSNVNTKRAA